MFFRACSQHIHFSSLLIGVEMLIVSICSLYFLFIILFGQRSDKGNLIIYNIHFR